MKSTYVTLLSSLAVQAAQAAIDTAVSVVFPPTPGGYKCYNHTSGEEIACPQVGDSPVAVGLYVGVVGGVLGSICCLFACKKYRDRNRAIELASMQQPDSDAVTTSYVKLNDQP